MVNLVFYFRNKSVIIDKFRQQKNHLPRHIYFRKIYIYFLVMNLITKLNINKNVPISTITAPEGRSREYEVNKPINTIVAEITIANTVKCLKDLENNLAIALGVTSKALTKMMPINFILRIIATAVDR